MGMACVACASHITHQTSHMQGPFATEGTASVPTGVLSTQLQTAVAVASTVQLVRQEWLVLGDVGGLCWQALGDCAVSRHNAWTLNAQSKTYISQWWTTHM
jgi:hypothetical protein